MKVHTGEEIVRERALRLVHTKLKTNTTDLLNREAQAQVLLVFLSQIWLVSFQLIAEIKKVFASATVTGEEFPRLMAILNMTYLPKSTAGQVGSLMIVDDKTNCQLIHILEFRRKWQLWWQQWPIWTCQRTLITQGGREICIFDKITDNRYLQCWSNGQTVAVCNSRPSLLLGICKKTNRISRWCHFAF